jgi:peptidoglycan/LPS O-acetylase OafA/YrhL
MMLEMKRIPTLDGWRGIAILLVLITHLQAGLWGHVYGGHRWLDLGQHGVTIFFVLSGYIITAKLLDNEEISLKRFYLRRFFRLMPCAWLYLISVAAIAKIIHVPIIGPDAWSSIFFFRNYLPTADNYTTVCTAHFWTLSLEEQFYLVWPFVLLYAGRKRSLHIAISGAAACAILRLSHWVYYSQTSGFHTEVRADALLIGCALAMLLKNETIQSWIKSNGLWLFCFCAPAYIWHITAVRLKVEQNQLVANIV